MSAQNIIRSFEAVVDDVKPSERSVVSKIGGMAVDRHRTRITPSGIDLTYYRQNPVVLHEHGRCPTRGTLPVGRNQWIKVDGDRMVAKTIFRNDAYSDALFNAYKDDWMRGWSINAIAHEASPPTDEEMRSSPDLRRDCDLVYRRTELIEYSTTSMPSHRDALTLMVSRGIWVPDEAKAEAEEMASRTAVAMPGLPDAETGPSPESRTMTDSSGGLAGGGAAVEPTVAGADAPRPAGRLRKRGGRLYLVGDDGATLGGPYDTEDEATGQVESSRRQDEGRAAPGSSGKTKLDAIEEAMARLPELHPDYGQVFYNPETDEIFVNFSDSDERDTTRKWMAAMAAIVGKDKVGGEAEGGVEKYKSWKQLRSADDPVEPDGRGGWSVRGVDGVAFPDEATARRAAASLQAPESFEAIFTAESLAKQERNAAVVGSLRDEVRAIFELQMYGKV